MYLKVITLLIALHSATAANDFCYSHVINACSPVGVSLYNCNATYGGAINVFNELQNYVNTHISRSFQFLLMPWVILSITLGREFFMLKDPLPDSTIRSVDQFVGKVKKKQQKTKNTRSSYFGNHEQNREGFSKLYRKLSDGTWEKSIDLIKYITKRGGSMDFKYKKETDSEKPIDISELFELASLGKALDMMKMLAEEGRSIHYRVVSHGEAPHDPGVSSYIENNFVPEHVEIIRDLAGHWNDLKQIISENTDASLATFLFDNYLKNLS